MFSVYTDCFFFNDTATTEIYTLSLHDALPILFRGRARAAAHRLEPSRLASSIRLLRSGAEPDSAQSPPRPSPGAAMRRGIRAVSRDAACQASQDRKSTRLNSSHGYISYAVFCLKKKNRTHYNTC